MTSLDACFKPQMSHWNVLKIVVVTVVSAFFLVRQVLLGRDVFWTVQMTCSKAHATSISLWLCSPRWCDHCCRLSDRYTDDLYSVCIGYLVGAWHFSIDRRGDILEYGGLASKEISTSTKLNASAEIRPLACCTACSTLVLGTLSCHLTCSIRHRQHWNLSNAFMCQRESPGFTAIQ